MNNEGLMPPRPSVRGMPMTEICILGSCLAEEALLATHNIEQRGTSGEPWVRLEEHSYPQTKPPDPDHQEVEHSPTQPSVEEESQPGSAVQSAAFSRNCLVKVGQSAVISKPSAATDNVIAVQSENLPETTIFSRDSHPSSALLSRRSPTRTPSASNMTGLCDPTEVMSNEEVSCKIPLMKNLFLTYSADSFGSSGSTDDQLSSRSSSVISWEDVFSRFLSTGQVVSTASYQGDTELVRSSTEQTKKAPFETVVVGECREESVEREGETLDTHTTPKASLTVFPGTSEMECPLMFDDLSTGFCMVTIPPVTLKHSDAPPSKTETFAKDTAAVEEFQKISEELVKTISVEALRTVNRKHHHESVGKPAETPEKQASSKVSPQTFPESVMTHKESSLIIPTSEESEERPAESLKRRTSPGISPPALLVSGTVKILLKIPNVKSFYFSCLFLYLKLSNYSSYL
ncbi:uncharacterized protein LOC134036499 [Osmerus eperlanus]|uniref:uncharacterized protein LOC134036499 n=1 Tax=Osmerus eperlanus TaxID=29151 RepID=UPI002E144C2B